MAANVPSSLDGLAYEDVFPVERKRDRDDDDVHVVGPGAKEALAEGDHLEQEVGGRQLPDLGGCYGHLGNASWACVRRENPFTHLIYASTAPLEVACVCTLIAHVSHPQLCVSPACV